MLNIVLRLIFVLSTICKFRLKVPVDMQIPNNIHAAYELND